jgi:ornithine cyclodeaminase
MILLELDEIEKLVNIKDLFGAVRQSFIDYSSGKVIASPVNLLHFDNDADAHIKIAAIKGYDYFTVKVATMFPQNSIQNLPVNNGAIFIFDANTGAFIAILKDKGYLTDLRTAVAGATITHEVAKKDADTVSLIGTGFQGYYQILALKELRNINKLTIYGRTTANVTLLKDKIESEIPNIKITIAPTIEEAVKNSAIIITTTSSTTPIIKSKWLTQEQHITAIGADDTFKKELEIQCFENASNIFIDSIELNKKYGEFSEAFAQNNSIINKTIEFGEFFSNSIKPNNTEEITIAKLVGVGVQDLAAATVVMNKYNSKNLS